MKMKAEKKEDLPIRGINPSRPKRERKRIIKSIGDFWQGGE